MQRRNPRLSDFDYSSEGAYFVTICVQCRDNTLSEISPRSIDGPVVTETPIGNVVRDQLKALPSRFPEVSLDEMIIMPDHLHCILFLRALTATSTLVGARLASTSCDHPSIVNLKKGDPRVAPTLGRIVGAFKSLATQEINKTVGRSGQFWQRNYHERVIRNEEELQEKRKYIIENPLRWVLKKT